MLRLEITFNSNHEACDTGKTWLRRKREVGGSLFWGPISKILWNGPFYDRKRQLENTQTSAAAQTQIFIEAKMMVNYLYFIDFPATIHIR